MEIIKRGRGRPKKIINITEPDPEPADTIEEHWAKKSKARENVPDEISISSIAEEDDEFLNELDNEHYNDEPFQKVDDIFKDIKVKKPKKEKERKSHFEDDNSLFDEKGTEILGKDRRMLLSKIRQYKSLFPEELKKFKIKKNCSIEDLNLYLFLNLSTPAPCLIKSYGLNENAPMSDKSTSTCNVWFPKGTPQIIKSPASFVLTV
jgi:hypothetical protein